MKARAKGLSQQAGSVTPKSGKFAGQTFPSYRALQNARARAKGFANQAQRLAAPPRAKASAARSAVYSSQQAKADRVILQLQRASRDGEKLSLSQAARANKTTPAFVRRYSGSSLQVIGSRFEVVANDKASAYMTVLTPEGIDRGLVRGFKARSRIGRHWNAVADVENAPTRANISALEKYGRAKFTFADGRRVQLLSSIDEIEVLTSLGRMPSGGPYGDTGMARAA